MLLMCTDNNISWGNMKNIDTSGSKNVLYLDL